MVDVALEVLRRNDDDPQAACEMLAEFQSRVQRLVRENADSELFQGEEVTIAEHALNATDWDPNRAFASAQDTALAVQQTRALIKAQGYRQFTPVESTLPALTAAEGKPHTATAMLLGMPEPPAPLHQAPRVVAPHCSAPPVQRRGQASEEEDGCAVM